MNVLKRFAARLPTGWQHQLRRIRSWIEIRRGNFHPGEPEFDRLSQWLKPGDWALDIGANMGSYTVAMSRLVGEHGRVIALEPIPETFAILTANLQIARCGNVTAFNAAASDRAEVAEMYMPHFDSGLKNFYQARLDRTKNTMDTSANRVLTIAIDSLALPHRLALIKIDVEGHEAKVISGLWKQISRDRPALIIETSSPLVNDKLSTLSYQAHHIPGSPNRIFLQPEHERPAKHSPDPYKR